MTQSKKRRMKRAGLPPGTLIHTGAQVGEKVSINIIDYAAERLEEKEEVRVEECFPFRERPTVTWINVNGLHRVDIIENIGTPFGIHPLVLEDILNTTQRPKMEDFGEYLFVVLKMTYSNEATREITVEQVSMILGSNFVISFQEREGDVFNPVRERIKNGKGRIRKMGADYLCYALIDAVVDNYFVVLESVGERIEALEEEVVGAPEPETLQKIHKLKRQMIVLRKSVWPLRELIGGLQRAESPLVRDTTEIYLRDVYDHTIQVIDTTESFRDMVSGMLDIYLSSISNRMNEVMKVLTIIATIFIPLTFIAGIYGMNFKFMPELEWRYAYPLVWLMMGVVVFFMLRYFRKKRWL